MFTIGRQEIIKEMPATQHANLGPRYQVLRKAGMRLSMRLVESLSKGELQRGASNLGILQGQQIVFDTEDQSAVLMDYCIHDLRQNGVSAVEKFLAAPPPGLSADETVFLEGMRSARYSLFVVEAATPGAGIDVRDMLRDDRLFIVDMGFSRSARPGLVMASRVLSPEGINMTSGAALPVGVLPVAKQAELAAAIRALAPNEDVGSMSPEQISKLTARIIRSCLQRGAARHVRYEDVDGKPGRRHPAAKTAPAASNLGRNSPCPCGSGKKFKVCCGGWKR